MTDLKQLRKLAENATPGPWHVGYWAGQCHLEHHHTGESNCKYDYTLDTTFGQTDIVGPEPITLCSGDDWGPHFDSKTRLFVAAANPQTILQLLDENAILRKKVIND